MRKLVMDLLGEVEDPVGLACPPLDDMFLGMGEIESESCLSGLGDLDGFFDEVGDMKKEMEITKQHQPKKIIIRHRRGNFGKGKDIKNLFLEPEINCESEKLITPETPSSMGSDSCLSDGNVKKKIIIRHRFGNLGKGKDIKNLFPESPSPIEPKKQPIRDLGKGNKVFKKQPQINCEINKNSSKTNIMDYNSKLEASKRKLRQGYEAADRAKRQRIIQIIKPHDLSRVSSTGKLCRFKNEKLQKLYENHKANPGLF